MALDQHGRLPIPPGALMSFPAREDADLCQICDDRIEEPRRAVGLTSCWPCAAADPASPPWDITPTAGPVWMGYDPGVDLQ